MRIFRKQWSVKRFYEQTFFRISYIKWYKFYNNNLLAVLGTTNSKPQTRELIVNSVSGSFIFNFLGYFAESQVIFQWEKTKQKLGNVLDA